MVKNKGILVITHSIHKQISKEEAYDALSDSDKKLAPNIEYVDVNPVSKSIEKAEEIDWAEAVVKQRRIAKEHIQPLLESNPDYKIVYFGATPIPLAINLGYLIGNWRDIEARLFHHENKDWNWISNQSKTIIEETGIPSEVVEGEGEAVIKLSTSHPIHFEDIDEVVEKPLKKISIALNNHNEDALESLDDLNKVAQKFKEALDGISDFLPNVTRIHLFASIPVGLAFLLGTKISPTIHRNIQAYQYKVSNEPKYSSVIIIQGVPEQDIVLEESDLKEVAELREKLKKNYENQIHPFIETLKDSGEWYGEVVDNSSHFHLQNPYWSQLPALKETILTKSTIDAETTNPPGEGFFFDRDSSVWQFEDTFLHIIKQRLTTLEEQLRGLRILLFHEGVHYRGHKLTGSTVDSVGRFPKVLEEVDYQADVWAMIHEFALAKIYDFESTKNVSSFFRDCIKTASEMMWAFDDRGIDLLEMQIRRINRYLIWYWQYLRLTHEECNDIKDVISILADKPIIEIRGLNIISRGPRIFYQLEKIDIRDLEIAVVWKNVVERRASGGALQLESLINGFKERDGDKILESLTTLFDQITD